MVLAEALGAEMNNSRQETLRSGKIELLKTR
jgi:hypothetical protein